MAAVAALFQKTFGIEAGRRHPRLPAISTRRFSATPATTLKSPPACMSTQTGRVTGFIGVFPRALGASWQAFRAAIAGTLMVEHPEREPLAGAKLLRSVIKGPQDISISETTNLISQRLWEPLGGKVVPLLSLDWFRIFTAELPRPSRCLRRGLRAGDCSRPQRRAADWIGGSWTRSTLQPGEASGRLLWSIANPRMPRSPLLSSSCRRRSIFVRRGRRGRVEWLLSQAARKERYGAASRAIVSAPKGEPLGCYIYHGRPGGIGRVLQMLARTRSVGDCYRLLFHEADQAGLRAFAAAARHRSRTRC